MQNKKLLILSIISILNVVLIPTFDVWGGLFPSDIDNNFFEAIGSLFTDSEALRYWSVIIILSIFVPSLLMLISAIVNKKALFAVSSIIGIILWFRMIISYVSQYGLEELFDFDDGSISIGTWIAILLFILSLIVVITSKKKNNNSMPMAQTATVVETNNSINQVVIEHGSFCPNCGKKIDRQSPFCGNCGYKF